MKMGIALPVALMAALLSQGAVACGDSLYRVGKGLSYRTYSAPLPGHLLVLATSDADRQRAEMLAKSGHDVHLVASPEDLAAELQNGAFDVVIAPYAARASVEAVGEGQASFLPVAMTSDEGRQAKRQYGNVLRSEDDIKRFLKVIHKTLKARA